jgi:hypothetical protein
MTRALAGALALASCGAGSDEAPAPAQMRDIGLSVEVAGDELRPTFVVRLSERVAARLPEGKVDEGAGRGVLRLQVVTREGDAPAIVGRYERTGTELRFRPALPLHPGTRYQASAEAGDGGTRTLSYATRHAPETEPTRVRSIEPAVDEVPANLLRFYVQFSAPMQGGDQVYEHVHLIDRMTGEPVEMAWREVQLWSPDRARLTLLVHPGRVKRDITFAADLGPVLHAGRSYRLVLDEDLADAGGRPLAAAFHADFTVAAADDRGPDPDAWRLAVPTAGTTGALALAFDEPMDAELLRTRIRAVDSDGGAVSGTTSLPPGGTTWEFTPAAPWAAGPHALVFSGELEDLAGNTSTAPFDRPPNWAPSAEPLLRMDFEIGP